MSSIVRLKNINDKTAIIDIDNPFVGVKCVVNLTEDDKELSSSVKNILQSIADTDKNDNDDLFIVMNENVIFETPKIKRLLFKEIRDCSIELSDKSITVTFFDNIYDKSNAEEYVEMVMNDNISKTIDIYRR